MIPREVVTMLARRRVVAEVRTDTAVQALGVVEALVAGGVTAVEVSLAIPGAREILTHLAMRQDALIGAGAVLEARQASEAISSGARFISSPIFTPDLVPVCRDANVACVLGALTPTEIIAAQRAGAEMVKLFPADALGGPQYVRSLFSQLTHLSLQVSGGITPANLGDYLALPVRTLALGSVLVPPELVERGNWQAITMRARAFVEYILNPHAYAAQFLAMMGVSPRAARPAEVNEAAAAISAVPTMPTPEGSGALAEAAMARIEEDEQEPGRQVPVRPGASSPGAGSGEFKPWDSRPIEQGDEEDWLR